MPLNQITKINYTYLFDNRQLPPFKKVLYIVKWVAVEKVRYFGLCTKKSYVLQKYSPLISM